MFIHRLLLLLQPSIIPYLTGKYKENEKEKLVEKEQDEKQKEQEEKKKK